MNPNQFVRILVGNLGVKFPIASKPSFSGVHPSTSPCFCKISLKNFPTQFTTVPLITQENQIHSHENSLAACFTLDKTHIDKFLKKQKNPILLIEIYTGRRGTTCGLNSGKLLGTVPVEIDLGAVETRASNILQGWVGIGNNNKKGSSAQLYLSVKAEPDPRFVFEFGGEPECSPLVYQVHGSVRQPVFSCKFSFRNMADQISLPSEQSNSTSSKHRKGWQISVHDLSGSVVAIASMVTRFVPSPGSPGRVSQSSPGVWLIFRHGDVACDPWGRLEAWRERRGPDAIGYRFHLFSSPDATSEIAAGTLSSKNGGKFCVDKTSSVTAMDTPRGSWDFGSGSWNRSRTASRSGSGSGFEFGSAALLQLYRGFVMSSTVRKMGKSGKPTVEVGVKHVTCTEDAAAFVALAAAMDLSMDACGSFSKKLRKELRQQ
ncbi:uncharacterized protein LOC142642332 [Castanea sativa]|uniref:uncharacterized protein LOC142642332 n=1 Tax=Castanea sativa TaxID=21020 RepID=UPI003F651CE6